MTPIIEGMQPKHAWTDADARLARTGHYNAHEGGGWQPCVDTVSVTESSARDARVKQEQAQHTASLGVV